MADLIEQIKNLSGRILIVGLGSAGNGDDAAGLYVAQHVSEEELSSNVNVALCESDSDLFRLIGTLSADNNGKTDDLPDHVIFIDAVELGGRAGEIALLESAEIKSKFPQVSTHKISLSTIAKFIESNGKTRVWLIGIQVKDVGLRSGLSQEVIDSANAVIALLTKLFVKNTKHLSSVEVINYVQS